MKLVSGRKKVVIMKMRKMLVGIALILAFVVLACSRSGEVLTMEEATRRAMPTPLPTLDPNQFIDGAIEVGAEATLTGRQFLVNILDNPNGAIVAGESRGTTVVVQQSVQADDGILWYQVLSSSGQIGWVKAENLEAKEAPGGIAVGDTFTLTGKLFLVNILEEPSPVGKIIGGVARGEVVTVVQVTSVDGKFWYQVDTSGGIGWVSEDNVQAEEGS